MKSITPSDTKFMAVRERLGRLLGLRSPLGEAELRAAQVALSDILDQPAFPEAIQHDPSYIPPATVPLLLHHLGEAWAQGNSPLAENLERFYAEMTRNVTAGILPSRQMPDFTMPFASCRASSVSGRATHTVFDRIRCWEGVVPAGYNADMLGAMIQTRFLVKQSPAGQSLYVRTMPPAVNEEYFEYIDVLESVFAATGVFTMIELGAGFGRWLMRAACAARSTSGVPCRLIGVEAEPEHFQWMKLHFRDNGFDPDQHQLVEAAAAAQDGEVLFHVGNPLVARPT